MSQEDYNRQQLMCMVKFDATHKINTVYMLNNYMHMSMGML